jgi:acetyltransferase-like isoleucine patch superfamily enzyme
MEGVASKGPASASRLMRRIARRVASRVRLWKLRISFPGEDITIGHGVFIGPGFRLRFEPGARLLIGDRVSLRQRCTLEVGPGAELVIGDDTELTFDVVVQCAERVRIGMGCMFANGSSVVDSRHQFHGRRTGQAQTPLETWPIEIGDGVWVSSKSTVSASVGFGSVIGAHSFVSRAVPDHVLAYGVPAKPGSRLGEPEPAGRFRPTTHLAVASSSASRETPY